MRVQIVDPPAYTPPYDRSLSAALAAAGADVELVTSPFAWGPVPEPEGYRATESFYPRSSGLEASSPLRRPLRALEHVRGMRSLRARAREADVVHYQWLPLPAVDARLLPRGVPLVQTPHGLLRAEAWRGSAAKRNRDLLRRMDAVVSLSDYGAGVLEAEAGIDPARIRVIPHGPLDYLTRIPDPAPLPPELAQAEGPVALFFGLIRPYKGVDLLLEAFAGVEGAELWVVGRPFGVELGDLMEAAARARSTVRFVPRFVTDREIPAMFERADLVVLPHRDAEQSGVLFTALAFGKAMLMSDVGGFPEVAALGAGRTFPSGDPDALAAAMAELLADTAARAPLEAAARDAATGPYSWSTIAGETIALYDHLVRR